MDGGKNETDDNIDAYTELEQLSSYVKNSISCLLRIWLLIQKPGPHARFISTGRFDVSVHQRWDEGHVREKFKNIPEWLIVRLGKANTRRRQFLEYRKSHNERIKSPQSMFEDKKTVVSSIPSRIKNNEYFQESAGSQIMGVHDVDDGYTVTSYAETTTNQATSLLPPVPSMAQGGAPFQCPYCFMVVDGIYSKAQWK